MVGSSRKRDFGVCFWAEAASLCCLTMVTGQSLSEPGRTDREISREHFQESLESTEKRGEHREIKKK